jgi:hypothetical protein
MKNTAIIIIAAFSISLGVTACNGDHSTRVVSDTTAKTDLHVDPSIKNDSAANVDTSKTTTTTGDASSVDNSGSGGTKIAKDTVGMKAKHKK